MTKNFIKLISTFFYIGYCPIAPGSVASFAGMLLAIGFLDQIWVYSLILIILTVLGFLTAGKTEKILNEDDPSCVVIDEVVGIMIACFMLPLDISVLITAFFLFRAFDMFKIYPASYFEKKHGSFGIMMDDVAAGVYANIVVRSVLLILKMYN